MAIKVTLLGWRSHEDSRHLVDYELIDLLRILSYRGANEVIERKWVLTEFDLTFFSIDTGGYSPGIFEDLFPEVGAEPPEILNVSGERLMERAALIHQLEEGLLCRRIAEDLPVEIDPDFRLYPGPMNFQATNIDLEIRRTEMLPYHVITEDEDLVAFLQRQFTVTEVDPPGTYRERSP